MFIIYLFSVWVEQQPDMFQHLITIMWMLWGAEVGLKVHYVPLPPLPSPPPVALVLVMQTCYEYRRLWHLTRAVFCEVLFSVLNTVTLFCTCPCFVKDHIYFTIFVDKNYLILIVFFYLNKTIIQLISPPSPTLPTLCQCWLCPKVLFTDIKSRHE